MPTLTVMKKNIARCKGVTPTRVFNSFWATMELHGTEDKAILCSFSLMFFWTNSPFMRELCLFCSKQLITVTIRRAHNSFLSQGSKRVLIIIIPLITVFQLLIQVGCRLFGGRRRDVTNLYLYFTWAFIKRLTFTFEHKHLYSLTFFNTSLSL